MAAVTEWELSSWANGKLIPLRQGFGSECFVERKWQSPMWEDLWDVGNQLPAHKYFLLLTHQDAWNYDIIYFSGKQWRIYPCALWLPPYAALTRLPETYPGCEADLWSYLLLSRLGSRIGKANTIQACPSSVLCFIHPRAWGCPCF